MEKEKKQKAKKDEPIDFLKYYVKPHNKKSREVKPKDLKKIIEDAHIMFNLCFTQNGIYPGGYAVAHSQINDKDPLRFFVTNRKEIFINPVITRHTEVKIDSEEGCLSFPEEMPTNVKRWNKCEVEFITLDEKSKTGLSEKQMSPFKGQWSKVMQHEINHLDAVYIFEY